MHDLVCVYSCEYANMLMVCEYDASNALLVPSVLWLSVWSEVQTCLWPSWCHCHSLSLAPVKSRLVLPFWYRLTPVVLKKRPLNGCSSNALLIMSAVAPGSINFDLWLTSSVSTLLLADMSHDLPLSWQLVNRWLDGVERISTFQNKVHQGIQLCLGDSGKYKEKIFVLV